MSQDQVIHTVVTHQDVDITKNSYSEGNTMQRDVDVSTMARNGMFSLQVEIESSSTSTSVTGTWYESNDGVNFVSGGTITSFSAVDVSSGLDAIYTFEPKLCKWLRIRITENNIGTIADCTCTLAVS